MTENNPMNSVKLDELDAAHAKYTSCVARLRSVLNIVHTTALADVAQDDLIHRELIESARAAITVSTLVLFSELFADYTCLNLGCMARTLSSRDFDAGLCLHRDKGEKLAKAESEFTRFNLPVPQNIELSETDRVNLGKVFQRMRERGAECVRRVELHMQRLAECIPDSVPASGVREKYEEAWLKAKAIRSQLRAAALDALDVHKRNGVVFTEVVDRIGEGRLTTDWCETVLNPSKLN